jgi:hypothetical protein
VLGLAALGVGDSAALDHELAAQRLFKFVVLVEFLSDQPEIGRPQHGAVARIDIDPLHVGHRPEMQQ